MGGRDACSSGAVLQSGWGKSLQEEFEQKQNVRESAMRQSGVIHITETVCKGPGV